MTNNQLAIAVKLRILNIMFEALQADLPEQIVGQKQEDIRKDANDFTINVWTRVGDESVRRMFNVKVKEVK